MFHGEERHIDSLSHRFARKSVDGSPENQGGPTAHALIFPRGLADYMGDDEHAVGFLDDMELPRVCELMK